MAHAGHHNLPLLSGPNPGVLDASQPSRVLRTPTCSLFFAAFDPLTARASMFPNISSLHIDPEGSSKRANLEATASANGKRVVIETDPESGTCSWRFVPRARMAAEAMGDEGSWPRVVELCGRLVRMTQDQWDIHKLDPEYDCFVPASPSVSTITRITPNTDAIESEPASTQEPPATPPTASGSVELDDITPTPRAKRHISPPSPDSESPRKKQRVKATFSQSSDNMAVDEDIFYVPTTPVPQVAAENIANGKKRRRVSDRLGESSTLEARKMKEMPSRKRRGTSVFADLSSNPLPGRGGTNDNAEVPFIPTKRVRTRSPGTVRRSMEQKRIDREKKRKADMDMRFRERRNGMNRAFWKDIGVEPSEDNLDAPFSRAQSDGSEAGTDANEFSDANDSTTEDEGDDDTDRLTKIQESRRKLAELEKDKPIWEESARRRQQRETEEEQMRQRSKALREEEERLQERARAARRQREEQSDQERREREREARVREQSGRMFVSRPRSVFQWGSKLALERYVRTAAEFDTARFSADNPMTFTSIPWPVLYASFSVQDVDWDAVETFFKAVQRLLIPAEFKQLLVDSQRRYHPDRWRSRGLLVSVKNETERDLLEVAGSTVAQAITPLWKELTGR